MTATGTIAFTGASIGGIFQKELTESDDISAVFEEILEVGIN